MNIYLIIKSEYDFCDVHEETVDAYTTEDKAEYEAELLNETGREFYTDGTEMTCFFVREQAVSTETL